jgi:hypothetical protein
MNVFGLSWGRRSYYHDKIFRSEPRVLLRVKRRARWVTNWQNSVQGIGLGPISTQAPSRTCLLGHFSSRGEVCKTVISLEVGTVEK